MVRELARGQGRVVALRFSADGGRLFIAEEQGRIAAYRTDDWTKAIFESSPRKASLNDIAVAPTDDALAVAYSDSTVAFISASTGELQGEEIKTKSVPISLSYARRDKGSLLVVGTEVGQLQMWDTSTGELIRSTQAHASRINVVRSFPDGRIIVTVGRDREVDLWDTASGERITVLYGPRRQLTALAVSADGKTLATGGLLGDVRIWRSQRN